MFRINKQLLVFLSLLPVVPAVFAQDYAQDYAQHKPHLERQDNFNGPGSTIGQLEEDEQIRKTTYRLPAFDESLQPWFDWKARLSEGQGLNLGVAYTSLFQSASDGPEGVDRNAGSGIFRFSGVWNLYNPDSADSGRLVFSTDHRHAYDDTAPADLGFNVGYLGIPGTLFNDSGTLLGDLNWQQYFNDRQTGLIVGRYDPNDFFDVLGYANPWTSFQNLAVLFNASIALPDWGTGIGIGHRFDGKYYAQASISDANGVATEEKFFEDFGELYTTAEVGWSPSAGERFLKNVHLTVWHVDDREDAGVEESEGVAFGGNWTWKNSVMAFAKAGWSRGSAPLYNKSVTVGMIRYAPERADLVGAGLNWGEPSDGSLRNQWSFETFYRIQVAQNLAITPSLQILLNPSLSERNSIYIAGLRLRMSI